MMKVIGIPDNDSSPYNLGGELCGCVAVTTYLQILENPEWSTRRRADEPKCNRQFLTMVTQMNHLFLFIDIMQCKSGIWNKLCVVYLPCQCLQCCMDFIHLRMVLIIDQKCMHLVIHFNPGATWLFLHTPFHPLPLNTCTEIPVVSCSIDV